MPTVATVPAWTPPIPAIPPSEGSAPVMLSTGSEQPMMSPEELRAMLERNMGHPLISVHLGEK